MAAARFRECCIPLPLCSRGVFQATGKAGKVTARPRSFARIKKMGSGGADNTTVPARAPERQTAPGLTSSMNSPMQNENKLYQKPREPRKFRFSRVWANFRNTFARFYPSGFPKLFSQPIPNLLPATHAAACGGRFYLCPRAIRGPFYFFPAGSWRPGFIALPCCGGALLIQAIFDEG